MIPVVQEWITRTSRGHRPRLQLQRKESSHGTTNGYGSFADRREPAAQRRRRSHRELETLGPVLIRTAVGHGARGFLADAFLHEGALQISAGGISVRTPGRGKSPARVGGTGARVDGDRRL